MSEVDEGKGVEEKRRGPETWAAPVESWKDGQILSCGLEGKVSERGQNPEQSHIIKTKEKRISRWKPDSVKRCRKNKGHEAEPKAISLDHQKILESFSRVRGLKSDGNTAFMSMMI